MATLPGMPDHDEPEPDGQPVDPGDGLPAPIVPLEPGQPGHAPQV